MEMISHVATVLVFVLACYILIRIGLKFRTKEPFPELEPRRLSDPATRKSLTEFFTRNGVVGDADIRAGVCLAPVSLDRIHPVALRFGNAYAAARRQMRNPNACSLYLIDSESGRPKLIDLDMDDIGEAARLFQRVAADQEKRNAETG